MNKDRMNTLRRLRNIEHQVHNRFTTEELERLQSIIEVELRERDMANNPWREIFVLERCQPEDMLFGKKNALEGVE